MSTCSTVSSVKDLENVSNIQQNAKNQVLQQQENEKLFSVINQFDCYEKLFKSVENFTKNKKIRNQILAIHPKIQENFFQCEPVCAISMTRYSDMKGEMRQPILLNSKLGYTQMYCLESFSKYYEDLKYWNDPIILPENRQQIEIKSDNLFIILQFLHSQLQIIDKDFLINEIFNPYRSKHIENCLFQLQKDLKVQGKTVDSENIFKEFIASKYFRFEFNSFIKFKFQEQNKEENQKGLQKNYKWKTKEIEDDKEYNNKIQQLKEDIKQLNLVQLINYYKSIIMNQEKPTNINKKHENACKKMIYNYEKNLIEALEFDGSIKRFFYSILQQQKDRKKKKNAQKAKKRQDVKKLGNQSKDEYF